MYLHVVTRGREILVFCLCFCAIAIFFLPFSLDIPLYALQFNLSNETLFGVRLVQIQQVYWTESPYKIIEKNVLLVAMNRITILTEGKDPRMTLSRLNSDWFIVAHSDFFLTKSFFLSVQVYTPWIPLQTRKKDLIIDTTNESNYDFFVIMSFLIFVTKH